MRRSARRWGRAEMFPCRPITVFRRLPPSRCRLLARCSRFRLRAPWCRQCLRAGAGGRAKEGVEALGLPLSIRAGWCPRGWVPRARLPEDCRGVVAGRRGAGRVFPHSKHRSRLFFHNSSNLTALHIPHSTFTRATKRLPLHCIHPVPLPSISLGPFLRWASGRARWGLTIPVGGRRRCLWRLRRRLRRRCRGPISLDFFGFQSVFLALFRRFFAGRSLFWEIFGLLLGSACLPGVCFPFF